jgi:hypothetical protein
VSTEWTAIPQPKEEIMSEMTPKDPDQKTEAAEKASRKALDGTANATEGGGDSQKEAGRTFQRK